MQTAEEEEGGGAAQLSEAVNAQFPGQSDNVEQLHGNGGHLRVCVVQAGGQTRQAGLQRFLQAVPRLGPTLLLTLPLRESQQVAQHCLGAGRAGRQVLNHRVGRQRQHLRVENLSVVLYPDENPKLQIC